MKERSTKSNTRPHIKTEGAGAAGQTGHTMAVFSHKFSHLSVPTFLLTLPHVDLVPALLSLPVPQSCLILPGENRRKDVQVRAVGLLSVQTFAWSPSDRRRPSSLTKLSSHGLLEGRQAVQENCTDCTDCTDSTGEQLLVKSTT